MNVLQSGNGKEYLLNLGKILEAEIKDGGFTSDNIKTFYTALKLGWLKIYLKSFSKWTVYPKSFELGVFNYGPGFRIEKMTSNVVLEK